MGWSWGCLGKAWYKQKTLILKTITQEFKVITFNQLKGLKEGQAGTHNAEPAGILPKNPPKNTPSCPPLPPTAFSGAGGISETPRVSQKSDKTQSTKSNHGVHFIPIRFHRGHHRSFGFIVANSKHNKYSSGSQLIYYHFKQADVCSFW